MQFSANYEVKSEASVILDGMELRIQHPNGLFKARIKNIVRKDRSTPFLLSLQITFDAPSLLEAKDIGPGLLLDCLNMLAFTTGSSFIRHRTLLIADAAPKSVGDCLVFADDIGHEDPQPILESLLTQSIERLLQFDAPPAVRKALRWYRIGISATQPEDQFHYFWFALEIIAEYQKPAERVTDKCPDCKSPLYCEACKKQPTHKMYAKQAIRALIEAVDKDCKGETIDALDEARNRLMHGATLKEIEEKLPGPSEDIVDVLGKVVHKALIHQFPMEILKNNIYMALPNTYIHRTLTGIVQASTVVQTDESGELSMGKLTGMQIQMVSDRPPQSGLPFVIEMTPDQFERLCKLSREEGDHREMCDRICQKRQKREDKMLALVVATDMTRIEEVVKRGQTGTWQDLFREIIAAKPPALYKPRQ